MRVRWSWLAGGLVLALSLASASPAAPRDLVPAGPEGDPRGGAILLSAIPPEEVFGPELATRTARDKRKLGWILDFVFWKFNKLLELKTRFLTAIGSASGSRLRSRPVSPPVTVTQEGATTEATVEFEGNRVSLVLPDELFGSAFTVVTDVSKIIGSVILNSARRTKTFIDALKPIFRRALGISESTTVVLGDRLPNQLVIPSVAGTTQEPEESPLTMDSLSSEEEESNGNSEETNDA